MRPFSQMEKEKFHHIYKTLLATHPLSAKEFINQFLWVGRIEMMCQSVYCHTMAQCEWKCIVGVKLIKLVRILNVY